eukprot:scaffold409_cov167-Ochromonas_danica.AAC.7
MCKDELDYGDTLCMSLERKNNAVYTSEKGVTLNEEDEIICELNESLQTTASMHRESKTGGWKIKTATFSVLQRKKGAAGLSVNPKEAFKTIGLISLPLHLLADGKVHDMHLTLGCCKSERAYVEVVISSSAVEKDNDAASVADDASTNASVQIPRTNSVRLDGSQTKTGFFAGVSSPAAADDMSTTGSQSGQQPLTSSVKLDSHDSRSVGPEASGKTKTSLFGGVFGASSTSTLPPPAPVSPPIPIEDLKFKIIELENALLASADIVEYERKRAKEASFRAARAEDELEALRGQTAKNSKNVESTNSRLIDQYEQEMRRLNEEVKRLQIQNEVNLTKVSKSEASVSAQVKAVQQELDRTKEEVKALQQERVYLTASLNQSNEENGRMKNLMSKASDEIDRLTEEKTAAEHSMQTVQTKQDENQVLLQELIQAKMSIGEVTTQLEEAKQTIKKLRGGQAPPFPQQQQQSGRPMPPRGMPAPSGQYAKVSSNVSLDGSVSSSQGSERSAMLVGFPSANNRDGKKPSNPFMDGANNGISSLKRGFGNVSSTISNLGGGSTGGNRQTAPPPRPNF